MKVLEINKEDLKNNLSIIKNLISDKSPNTKIIAVVKANGMGLDLEKYSRISCRKWYRIFGCCKFRRGYSFTRSWHRERNFNVNPNYR